MQMEKKPTMAILTGGGDVPGLNPCIKTLVYRAASEGIRVIGIRRGWAGILEYNKDDQENVRRCIQELTPPDVRTIDRTGGTFLHTSRTNPSSARKKDVPEFLKSQFGNDEEKKDLTLKVVENLTALGVDVIVPIGGDDTLSFADRLNREGFPVIAIPKTMDNDVFGTDYCIGFSTAVTRSVSYIHDLRTSTGSHERIAVIELLREVLRGDLSHLRLSLRGGPGHHLRGGLRPRETREAHHGGQEGEPQELCDDRAL